MFPTITIAGQKVFVVGLGLICCLFVFLTVIRYYTRKYNLKFSKFLAYVRLFLLLPYLGGRYVATVVDTRMIVPFFPLPTPLEIGADGTMRGEIMNRVGYWIVAILSPFNYNFHLAGVILGLCVAFWLFRRTLTSVLEERKWIDTIFYAITLSAILAGLFFLLGDTRVGKKTELAIGVVGLSPDSVISKYGGKVFPVGIFVSLLSLAVYIVTVVIQNIRRVYGVGLIGAVIAIIGLNIVHVFMDYSRIGFIEIGSWTVGIPLGGGNVYAFDLLNYVSIVVIGVLIWYWLHLGDGRTTPKKKNIPARSDVLVGRQTAVADIASTTPAVSPTDERDGMAPTSDDVRESPEHTGSDQQHQHTKDSESGAS